MLNLDLLSLSGNDRPNGRSNWTDFYFGGGLLMNQSKHLLCYTKTTNEQTNKQRQQQRQRLWFQHGNQCDAKVGQLIGWMVGWLVVNLYQSQEHSSTKLSKLYEQWWRWWKTCQVESFTFHANKQTASAALQMFIKFILILSGRRHVYTTIAESSWVITKTKSIYM